MTHTFTQRNLFYLIAKDYVVFTTVQPAFTVFLQTCSIRISNWYVLPALNRQKWPTNGYIDQLAVLFGREIDG